MSTEFHCIELGWIELTLLGEGTPTPKCGFSVVPALDIAEPHVTLKDGLGGVAIHLPAHIIPKPNILEEGQRLLIAEVAKDAIVTSSIDYRAQEVDRLLRGMGGVSVVAVGGQSL